MSCKVLHFLINLQLSSGRRNVVVTYVQFASYCTVKYINTYTLLVLYCIVLYFTVLYCTVLYCTVVLQTTLYYNNKVPATLYYISTMRLVKKKNHFVVMIKFYRLFVFVSPSQCIGIHLFSK